MNKESGSSERRVKKPERPRRIRKTNKGKHPR